MLTSQNTIETDMPVMRGRCNHTDVPAAPRRKEEEKTKICSSLHLRCLISSGPPVHKFPHYGVAVRLCSLEKTAQRTS